jgi:hypothetical protein
MTTLIPQLLSAGWKLEQITGTDLSDDGLKGYEGVAIDYDKMIDNELARKEFEAGKTVAVAPGGSVALVKPDGTASYVVGGAGTGEPGTDVPSVATADDYARIPPGSHYRDPQGNVRTKPGGAASNGSGTFPASGG